MNVSFVRAELYLFELGDTSLEVTGQAFGNDGAVSIRDREPIVTFKADQAGKGKKRHVCCLGHGKETARTENTINLKNDHSKAVKIGEAIIGLIEDDGVRVDKKNDCPYAVRAKPPGAMKISST